MFLPYTVRGNVGFCETEISGRKRIVDRIADGDWKGGGDVKERYSEQHQRGG